ncbi:MAG: Ig-like domain-containing protein, partial [Nocardioides sp.]
TPPTTGAPALTPDTNQPGARFPSLSWEPYPNVKHYKIRIGVAGAGFWDNTAKSPILTTNYAYPSATDIGEAYLSPDTYVWQVQAVDQNNVASAWGPTGTFTIEDLPAVSGQRIALDGQALDAGTTCAKALGTVLEEAEICAGVPATPVLDWSPVPGAGLYMVYVANDRELTNRVFTGAITTNSRWTPSSSTGGPEALADNQAGESYYWYVRPCKTIGRCGPDPISSDAAATNAFRKISPEVELLPPGANSVNECTPDTVTMLNGANCAGDIAFSWVDYHATNQAVFYEAGLAPSHQAGQKYRIEISRNAQFSPVLHFRDVDQPTYTWFDDTLPEGDLWWRVQAIDAKGNRLTWSDPARVTKDSGGVGLVSPIGNEIVPGGTPFAWTPKDHAVSYRLEVYRNDDDSYSPANLVFTADGLKLSSYVHSSLLPASSTPYRWRVRWTDAGGELGPWTPGGRFRVDRREVGLVSPAAGSFESPNGPLFTWDPVGSAVKYTVEARRVGGTSSVISQSTPATAWATTSPVADGEYEWRVTAFDASNGSLGSSAWRGFTIDTTRPTVTKKAPGTRATRGSNFVVTFSEPVRGASSTTMKLYVEGRTTPLGAVVTTSSDRRKATLNPNSNLVVGKRYQVKCTTGIKDDAGNKLVAYSWKVKAFSG